MLEKEIRKDYLSLITSLSKFNYNEENKMYIAFHSTKSVSALLNEKELEILINELQQAKEILHESNKNKKI